MWRWCNGTVLSQLETLKFVLLFFARLIARRDGRCPLSHELTHGRRGAAGRDASTRDVRIALSQLTVVASLASERLSAVHTLRLPLTPQPTHFARQFAFCWPSDSHIRASHFVDKNTHITISTL